MLFLFVFLDFCKLIKTVELQGLILYELQLLKCDTY